jgi:hypothetical protein
MAGLSWITLAVRNGRLGYGRPRALAEAVRMISLVGRTERSGPAPGSVLIRRARGATSQGWGSTAGLRNWRPGSRFARSCWSVICAEACIRPKRNGSQFTGVADHP